jgi:hypothetical protein
MVIKLDDTTAGRTYVAKITRDSDGWMWNGVSDFVADSTLTDAQQATAVGLATTTAVVSGTGTHSHYIFTVPAGITVACHVGLYLTSYAVGTKEAYWAEYDPTDAANKTILDKLNTTLVQDGAVYDFTAAALAAAPSSSGGSTGDGAYTVIIQVGVENAFVRLTLGATSYTAFTDADGEASFSCDAGTWTVGITAPAYLAFTPTLLIVTDDTTQAYTLTPATSVSDTFAEASDLYDMFGESNVKEWANMQELPITDAEYTTEIARRIEAALVYGTDEVKEFLRNGPYEEEFVTVPTSINRATCYKAGAWLFEWRRDSEENDRYSRMEAKADTILEQIKRGARQFDSVQTIEGTRAPGVVK